VNNSNLRYFIVYKPYGMLSQFTREGHHATLADLTQFPRDVYPVGRLDSDSEGLLLITNDKQLNNRILNPKKKISKTYWVQVDGAITSDAVERLQRGVEIRTKGQTFTTLPAQCQIKEAPDITERVPPVRFRKNIPTSWIELIITEGKNRQVRHMTAEVGFPTLRLVRIGIGNIKRLDLLPGEVVEITGSELRQGIGI
jgi:23S rRNA pseudouridine2457 synthase